MREPMMPSPMKPTAPAGIGPPPGRLRTRPGYPAAQCLGGEGDCLLGLREVLVRGAVAVLRQRRPLARRSAAGGGATLEAVALEVIPVQGPRGEVVLGERHV